MCWTDGNYTYFCAPRPGNSPLYDYRLIPTHMAWLFRPEELEGAQLYRGFSFTKGCPVLKIPANAGDVLTDPYAGGDMLFDMREDPRQTTPIENETVKDWARRRIAALMKENDAPPEQFERMGLAAYL